MSKKITVPEGMINAGAEALQNYDDCIPVILEAALRWLSENPIVPTPEQALEMATGGKFDHFDNWELVRWGSSEWQRRCFLAPEPELPEEERTISAMIRDRGTMTDEQLARSISQVLGEYRRGKESSKQ